MALMHREYRSSPCCGGCFEAKIAGQFEFSHAAFFFRAVRIGEVIHRYSQPVLQEISAIR